MSFRENQKIGKDEVVSFALWLEPKVSKLIG